MAVRDWAFVSFVAFLAAMGAYLSGYSVGYVSDNLTIDSSCKLIKSHLYVHIGL